MLAETVTVPLCWNWALPLESEATALTVYVPYSTSVKVAERVRAPLPLIATVWAAGVVKLESVGVRLTVRLEADDRRSLETAFVAEELFCVEVESPSTLKESLRSELLEPLEMELAWQETVRTVAMMIVRRAERGRSIARRLSCNFFTGVPIRNALQD